MSPQRQDLAAQDASTDATGHHQDCRDTRLSSKQNAAAEDAATQTNPDDALQTKYVATESIHCCPEASTETTGLATEAAEKQGRRQNKTLLWKMPPQMPTHLVCRHQNRTLLPRYISPLYQATTKTAKMQDAGLLPNKTRTLPWKTPPQL